MVSIFADEDSTRIVLRPNRSLSWRGNQLVILSLLIISAVISGGFAVMGAWVILPFAGFEMICLSAALYYVSWKLSYCHVVEIHEEHVILDKGVYYPKQSWRFSKNQLSLRLVPSNHEWDGPGLQFVDQGQTIEFGDFLNKSDRETLVLEVRRQGLPVRASQEEKLRF